MIARLWAAFLISAALALQSAPAAAIELNQQKGLLGYIVFMHTGPKNPDDPTVRAIAAQLVQAGYTVRSPEGDQDLRGGPGVDYFADEAKPAAQALSDVVNRLLQQQMEKEKKEFKPLQPRRQIVKNPANYLGLWLF